MFSKLKNQLSKKDNDHYTKAGFVAGIFNGIVIAIFIVFSYLFWKSAFMKELDILAKQFSNPILADTEKFYLVLLIITPPVVFFLYIIIGIYYGILIQKWLPVTPVKVILSCSLIGIIIGFGINMPGILLVKIAVSLFGWLVFSLLFIRKINKNDDKIIKE